MKIYFDVNVFEKAVERIRFGFENFDKVCVSFSAGKDSTIMLHLVDRIAREYGKKYNVLLVDLEAQYKETIDHAEHMRNITSDMSTWWWICLPLNLRNAVSVFEPFWKCWDDNKKDMWVREKPQNVVSVPLGEWDWWFDGMEFESFVPAFQDWLAGDGSLCSFVGIRADESLHRHMAVATTGTYGKKDKKSAFVCADGSKIQWSVQNKNTTSLYPIYDWRFEDIWKYVGENNLAYNKIYDFMYLAGVPYANMRICQPYGDDQRKGLDLFAKLEPESWVKVVNRVSGANSGALYAKSAGYGNTGNIVLPYGHTWKSYTFFLLSSLPDVLRERYLANFAVFLEWYLRNGIDSLDDVIDDEKFFTGRASKEVPSWRRLASVIMRNDFACKGLSIAPIKYVMRDIFEHFERTGKVKVRKSVKPVYEYLRGEYEKFYLSGLGEVDLNFDLSDEKKLEYLQRKYEGI